ncbi:hypothetical protein [Trichocoleus sp. FACHB-262]|uniref:hypothetical protein n=1 Tax=Trichocoleus sp. FACHB-262 TaxID=2692869 RepID=UPI0016899476|nr:hypothetical protein [Trichocoleus sp. FACHB-262]MBD2122461.1 hypothetical protein [Trichocoleus sp. FACHB-262]
MHFTKRGNFYQASRITGPRHNFLAIALTPGHSTRETVVEALPPVGECRHAALSAAAILSSVAEGVAKANSAFGTGYGVTNIQYVENDTPPEAVYGFMAHEIIKQLNSGGEFVEMEEESGKSSGT